MEKTSSNCSKPNHFAKMCRFQQVSEITEDSVKSEEECNLIMDDFESCSEFEIMSIQPYISEGEKSLINRGCIFVL